MKKFQRLIYERDFSTELKFKLLNINENFAIEEILDIIKELDGEQLLDKVEFLEMNNSELKSDLELVRDEVTSLRKRLEYRDDEIKRLKEKQ